MEALTQTYLGQAGRASSKLILIWLLPQKQCQNFNQSQEVRGVGGAVCAPIKGEMFIFGKRAGRGLAWYQWSKM